jgi:hypothetical protein
MCKRCARPRSAQQTHLGFVVSQTMAELNSSLDPIVQRIQYIRGQRVMLDSDIAEVYGVETKRLNEQVRRNLDRFPLDFMFQLDRQEFAHLKSQNATSSWGGRRTAPFAFTEHGAVMLASVLSSDKAIKASLYVVRAFVQLRQLLSEFTELRKRVDEMEDHTGEQFEQVFRLLESFIQPEPAPRPVIGFRRAASDELIDLIKK